jgi:hypothetical protein
LIIEVSLGFREDRSSASGKRYNPQFTRKIPWPRPEGGALGGMEEDLYEPPAVVSSRM